MNTRYMVAALITTLLPGVVQAQNGPELTTALNQPSQTQVEALERANAYIAGLHNAVESSTPLSEASEDAGAYFARRQRTGCNSCHIAFPKLNTYGRLVKMMGYQFPKPDLSEVHEPALKKAFRYVPFGVRAILDFANGDPSSVSGEVNVRELQLLGGGTMLNNRVSWWLHTHLVEDNGFKNPFSETPHELWGQYNFSLGDQARTRLSVRAGMSELPLWFAPTKTKLSEIPYAIYDAVPGESTFTLSTPQYGVMVHGSGFGREINSYALSAVNGRGDFDSQRFTQFFGRFTKTLPTASFGVFGFVGSQDLLPQEEHLDEEEHGTDEHGGEGAEGGDTEGPTPSVTDRFFRVGFDAEKNVGRANLYALGLYGRNGNPFAEPGVGSRSYYGGFIGADVSVTERLILSARYDGVRFRGPGVEELAHEAEGHQDASHEEPGHEEPSLSDAGHLHGELVRGNTDSLVLGVHYLLAWQMRLTTEFRRGFNGLGDKFIAGIQFAF